MKATQTKELSPVEAAHAEVIRLHNMRDELMQRINTLEKQAGDTSNTLTLDAALDTRRELFISRETLTDILKAVRAAEVVELQAIAADHERLANEDSRRAGQLREVIATDEAIVFQAFGQISVRPQWSDAEIQNITTSLSTWLKVARDAAKLDQQAMTHINESQASRQRADRLNREPLQR